MNRFKASHKFAARGLAVFVSGCSLMAVFCVKKLQKFDDPAYISKFPQSDVSDLPETVDWRRLGAVTSVDNQGNCGCCWACASIASLEGRLFLKTGKLLKLNLQELVSCRAGKLGCDAAGSPMEAYEYIKKNGIGLASDYPFVSGLCVTPSCRNVKKHLRKRVNMVTGCKKVPFGLLGDESHLMRAVSKGPVAAHIMVGTEFADYRGGLFSISAFSSDAKLVEHHIVCIVGYDNFEGKKVWVLKNSHSEKWGDNGYMLMERKREPFGNSGILLNAYYPTLEGDSDECSQDFVETGISIYFKRAVQFVLARVLDTATVRGGILEACDKDTDQPNTSMTSNVAKLASPHAETAVCVAKAAALKEHLSYGELSAVVLDDVSIHDSSMYYNICNHFVGY